MVASFSAVLFFCTVLCVECMLGDTDPFIRKQQSYTDLKFDNIVHIFER